MTRLQAWRGLIAIALLCTAGIAFAQAPAKELKDLLAGAWTLVSIHNVRADGTKYELFGPNAKGMLIFDGSGHFALHVTRAGRPMFASPKIA